MKQLIMCLMTWMTLQSPEMIKSQRYGPSTDVFRSGAPDLALPFTRQLSIFLWQVVGLTVACSSPQIAGSDTRWLQLPILLQVHLLLIHLLNYSRDTGPRDVVAYDLMIKIAYDSCEMISSVFGFFATSVRVRLRSIISELCVVLESCWQRSWAKKCLIKTNIWLPSRQAPGCCLS